MAQTRNIASPIPSSPDLPTSQEIVQRLVEHNQQRSAQLKSDTDERHYTVTYHGFPGTLTASMVVDATYNAPVTKRFQIVSHSGSKLLFNRVLKRLLDSEKAAALEPDKTALTPANYNFSFLGQQALWPAMLCPPCRPEGQLEVPLSRQNLYRLKGYAVHRNRCGTGEKPVVLDQKHKNPPRVHQGWAILAAGAKPKREQPAPGNCRTHHRLWRVSSAACLRISSPRQWRVCAAANALT